MVNITVGKDVLKQMVELGMRFSIIWDKQERVIPKEWANKLQELHERWNKRNRIWWVKWLPKNRDITKAQRESWNKLYWVLYDSKATDPLNNNLNLVKIWLNNYINEIKKRKPTDWWYFDHRFTLYKFLSQNNWIKNFIN